MLFDFAKRYIILMHMYLHVRLIKTNVFTLKKLARLF